MGRHKNKVACSAFQIDFETKSVRQSSPCSTRDHDDDPGQCSSFLMVRPCVHGSSVRWWLADCQVNRHWFAGGGGLELKMQARRGCRRRRRASARCFAWARRHIRAKNVLSCARSMPERGVHAHFREYTPLLDWGDTHSHKQSPNTPPHQSHRWNRRWRRSLAQRAQRVEAMVLIPVVLVQFVHCTSTNQPVHQ